MFAAEVAGLRALANTKAVAIPQVIDWAPAQNQGAAFLLLEWIEEKLPNSDEDFVRKFAEDLVALHSAPGGNNFGWTSDNFIGLLAQANNPHNNWCEFYRDCRLAPQLEIAKRKAKMPPRRTDLIQRVMDNLEALLRDFEPRPSILHGDLWSGNFIQSGERPYLIDPAVYRGERELEIAFIELFGGFPAGFINTYKQIFPLQPGYERRRPLHQLYPLLVHLNHFGETYGNDVERACELALRLL
jgi:fructosamine-3-kinase